MDFERLKRGMADIVEIAQTVPEPFRDRCFDALLNALLNEGEARPPEHAPPPTPDNGASPAAQEPTPPHPAVTTLTGSIPLKGQMRVFLQRTNISEATLGKVVSFVDGEIHFIHEPKPANVATGQIEWTLLAALKNAIENNAFAIDGNDVKKLCDEKGFLDPGNFWKILKRNEKLFTKPVTTADPRQTLSTEGQAELGKLIESLATR